MTLDPRPSAPQTLGPLQPGLLPYRPPPPDPRVKIRIDSNEGPGADSAVLEALMSLTSEALARYPKASDLEAMIAEQYGVAPEQVLATAGGDDALTRTWNAYLDNARNAVYAVPTFEMIPRGVHMTGALAKTAQWRSGDYPIDAIEDLIDDQTAVVYLVTPNNPTGLSATSEDAARIASRLAAIGRGGVLVVDLAYAEFDRNDLTGIIDSHANTVLVRTFSKAWSLAGIRLGYAVGDQAVIDAMRAVGNPYAVSTPSIEIGKRLAGRGSVKTGDTNLVKRLIDERDKLSSLLRSLGFVVTPSEANFVLAEHTDAALIHERLLEQGVSVRHWPNKPELRGMLRISCPGNPRDFDAVCHALRCAVELITR